MSGQEPGYVPPDHKTTAEFRVPGTLGGTRAAAPEPEATVVDEPLDTLQDVPAESGPDVTFQDVPVGDPSEDDVPGAAEGEAEAAEDRASVTVADIAVPPKAPAPDPVTVPDEPVAAENVALHEQVPPPAGHRVAEEAPWTEQFAAEAGPAPLPAEGTVPPPFEATSPAVPPAVPPSGGAPPSRSSGARRPLLVAALVGLVVLLVVVAAVLLLSGGGSEEKAVPPTAARSAPASAAPGGPSPGEAPSTPPTSGPGGGASAEPPATQVPAAPTAPAGPVLEGEGITYQLVQRSEGYFEGRMVITNRTDGPMRTWRLTFRVPGADVKNIWGARLVRGGENVEIRNLDGVPAIPPGGTWDVQFGASGATTTPEGCELNGDACGF